MSHTAISLVINDDKDFQERKPYVSPDGTVLAELGGAVIHADAEYWRKIAKYAEKMASHG